MVLLFRYLAVAVLFLVAQGAHAHKYATHNFDARIEGNSVQMELQVDTISCMELVEKQKPETKGISRQEVMPHRQLVYNYINEHLKLSSQGKTCVPSTLFTFMYLSEVDKFHFSYVLDCASPISEVTVDFSLFIDQVGLNTTIATVLSRSGGERYVFMEHSSATIRLSDLTGSPRPIKNIMKNYDPSKGFRSESERLRAMGKVADVKNNSVEQAEKSVSDLAPAQVAQKLDSGFLVFLKQGINHILSGLDHVLFVICLLVVAYEWKQLALVITSFTVAHTISLLLATFGLVRVSPAIVDPIIAASIVYVAVENVVRKEPRARLGVTFGFGLFHGLGFSAVLRDMLPGENIGWALFGFNAGVELGQLMVVLPFFPMLLYFKNHKESLHKKATTILCVLVALLATYWMIQRIESLISM